MTATASPLANPAHAKLDAFGDFLEQRCLPNGGMEISMLDGFLTVPASSPERVPAREWLPLVFGSEATQAEIGDFRDQVLARFDDVAYMLEAGCVSPIFLRGHASEEDDELTESIFEAGGKGREAGIAEALLDEDRRKIGSHVPLAEQRIYAYFGGVGAADARRRGTLGRVLRRDRKRDRTENPTARFDGRRSRARECAHRRDAA
jgi:hypothetical protein